jgi:hypothetical protein
MATPALARILDPIAPVGDAIAPAGRGILARRFFPFRAGAAARVAKFDRIPGDSC